MGMPHNYVIQHASQTSLPPGWCSLRRHRCQAVSGVSTKRSERRICHPSARHHHGCSHCHQPTCIALQHRRNHGWDMVHLMCDGCWGHWHAVFCARAGCNAPPCLTPPLANYLITRSTRYWCYATAIADCQAAQPLLTDIAHCQATHPRAAVHKITQLCRRPQLYEATGGQLQAGQAALLVHRQL